MQSLGSSAISSYRGLALLCLGILLSSSTKSLAENAPEPDLVTYQITDESSVNMRLTGTPADVTRGRAVVGDRKLGNCLACHEISDLGDLPFHGDIAPTLDGVADRYEEGEVRLLVINPKIVFPDTLMPAFYRVDGLHRVAPAFAGKPILTAQQVEDVVAYLMTLIDEE